MVAREAISPVPVTGRRTRRREKYTRKTMNRALTLGCVGIIGVLSYTIPYAVAAREGYVQNRYKLQIQSLSRENELLQTEVARLKSPERVAAYAAQSGMERRQGAQFLALSALPVDPAPKKSLIARLSSFRFR